MGSLIESIRAARNASVPLLAIETHDQPATLGAITESVNSCPQIAWDCILGLRGLNEQGAHALVGLGKIPDTTNIRLALKALHGIVPPSMIFFMGASSFLHEPVAAQGASNLRETYKENRRTAVFLGNDFASMHPALRDDVVFLREPLPTDDQIRERIIELHEDNTKPLKKDRLPSMVSAVRGLTSLFGIEQAVAISMDEETGVNEDALWERKEAAINTTDGLTISRCKTRFADLKGMNVIQEYLRRHQAGPEPFEVVLFLDEIEKAMAGSGGSATDSSGVSSDFLSVILKRMEGLSWAGMILLGIPGSGKTSLANAVSGEFGVPQVDMDFGAFKGRYVGDSETSVRKGFDVVEALGGKNVLVVATCNKMESLPPEFRRRFWLGNWYFDLPTKEEQVPIKKLYEKKFNTDSDWPDTEGWTGAEIRNCARTAYRLRISLQDAAKTTVPISKADPESVEALRNVADGRFLSVSYEGAWTRNRPASGAGRKARRKIGGAA